MSSHLFSFGVNLATCVFAVNFRIRPFRPTVPSARSVQKNAPCLKEDGKGGELDHVAGVVAKAANDDQGQWDSQILGAMNPLGPNLFV